MFRVNINKWIGNELHSTELALLKAEDELQNADMRVRALKARATRLRGRLTQAKYEPVLHLDGTESGQQVTHRAMDIATPTGFCGQLIDGIRSLRGAK